MNKSCSLNRTTELYLTTFNCILQKMICKMSNAKLTNSISHNFIVQMIPHHKAAIEMSEITLQFNICPELKPILDSIISSQKKGISEMQNLLHCLEC